MLICTLHQPTKQCLCEMKSRKTLADCQLCENGGSGISTDHTCSALPGQEFPLKTPKKSLTNISEK